MGKPNIASLSLNLDGCRFGDEFRHTRRQTENKQQQQFDSKQQQSKPNSNQLENSHPNQHNTQLGSPLSTYHYNHQPQYTAIPSHHPSHNNNLEPPSPLGNTYRHEGLSIGINFLRCNGINNGSLCIDDLIIEDCVGRGVCSSVWKARRKTPTTNSNGIDNDNNRNVESVEDVVDGIQNIDLEDNKCSNTANVQNIESQQSLSSTHSATYALKIFPLHDPTKRSMLIRELKLLCTFKCDCLVELEGAFLDNDNGGNNVTLVLEYMDCGSLVDLVSSSRSDNVDNVEDIIVSPNQQDVKSTARLPTTPGTPLFCNLSPPTSDNGKHRKVPEYALAAISYQILWGLCYLHYEGVLHRDIKVSIILSVRCENWVLLSQDCVAVTNSFLCLIHSLSASKHSSFILR